MGIPEDGGFIKNRSERSGAAAPAPASESPRLSRRFFLKGSSAAVATGAGVAAVRQIAPAQDAHDVTPAPHGADPVPAPPDAATSQNLTFFRPDEAQLVEALTARIIPGAADDPGAREAGVVYYIDRLLAHGDGFAEPTYRHPPFAMPYDGDAPPLVPVDGAPAFVWVHEDELERYGFQASMTPREMYQNGLAALVRYADSRFGSAFSDLSDDEQDQILMALEDGEADGFDAPSGADFFAILRTHTIEGMFADPAYGGNRDLVGWKLLGYPGAQRGYTPGEMKEEGTSRQPQSLAGLPHFHPGRPQQGPLLPVRGSQERFDEE